MGILSISHGMSGVSFKSGLLGMFWVMPLCPRPWRSEAILTQGLPISAQSKIRDGSCLAEVAPGRSQYQVPLAFPDPLMFSGLLGDYSASLIFFRTSLKEHPKYFSPLAR